MTARRALTAVGAGVTTFLLVAVLVIELLDVEFSAIVGLPVGLFVGLAVLVVVWVQFDEATPGTRRLASAYAAFGLAVLVLLALRYVNVGRNALSVDVLVGIGVAAAALVFLTLWVTDGDVAA